MATRAKVARVGAQALGCFSWAIRFCSQVFGVGGWGLEMPAFAGMTGSGWGWVLGMPAFAGMTGWVAGVTVGFAGVTVGFAGVTVGAWVPEVPAFAGMTGWVAGMTGWVAGMAAVGCMGNSSASSWSMPMESQLWASWCR